MWTGAISFGLVSVPVKLYSATEQHDVSFRQVHCTDGARVRFRRVCEKDGKEVPYADIAKGYELGDGQMLVLTDDDLADLPLPSAHEIEVLQFIPADQLDPLMLNRSYYIQPDKVGGRAYSLLRDALAKSGRIGLARVALRTRESLCALRVRDGLLVMETLLWPDEVRPPGFDAPDEKARPQEVSMAVSLIESMAGDFDPSQYTDGYQEALQALIAAKQSGSRPKPRKAQPAKAAGGLLDALQASLDVKKKPAGQPKAPAAAKRVAAAPPASPPRPRRPAAAKESVAGVGKAGRQPRGETRTSGGSAGAPPAKARR
jgi:DNA end-binding protein Ku